MASQEDKKDQIKTLERGDIYFFYRPKVEEESPQGYSDVQRLYIVLSPHERQRYRLAVIGSKQLPDPQRSGHRRYWGFVDRVGKDPESIKEELSGGTYETKTRGKRHVPAARPAGEGVYCILRHDDHTHLVYVLELPKEPGDVQKALHIEEEAGYILSIKNPDRGSPPSTGLSEDRQADFPKHLRDRFHGRKFIEADPPDFLDHEGSEFLLISASQDIQEELGITLNPDNESASTADIFKDLHLDRSRRLTKPLLEGKWE